MSLNAICLQALESHIAKSRGGRSGGDAESSFVNEIQALFADSLLGIVLFGSAARGESREGSDIDLLVVLGRERSLSRSLYSLWDERFGAIKESPHFVHIPANPGDAGSIWLEAAVDGIVLFDRAGVVSRFLGSIRRLIASGDRKRRWAYGHPYWVKGEGGNKNVQ
jgi:predicted nucleotidyltransferase